MVHKENVSWETSPIFHHMPLPKLATSKENTLPDVDQQPPFGALLAKGKMIIHLVDWPTCCRTCGSLGPCPRKIMAPPPSPCQTGAPLHRWGVWYCSTLPLPQGHWLTVVGIQLLAQGRGPYLHSGASQRGPGIKLYLDS